MKKLVDQCEYVPKTENFFNVLVTKKDSEIPNLQKYLKSIRKETVERLIYILFEDEKTKILKSFENLNIIAKAPLTIKENDIITFDDNLLLK